MISVLHVGDCLCLFWLKVESFQKYNDVVEVRNTPIKVFAVFDEAEGFLGLVSSSDAALFPNRIFADLLVRRAPTAIRADAYLDQALAQFRDDRCDFLPVEDVAGKFIGVISELSLFATLTEQERQSREAREGLILRLKEELEYRKMATLVFEATSEGILITDDTPKIIHVNQAFTQTTGYTLEEAVGQNPNMLQSGQQGQAFYEVMWRTLRESGSWEGEIWNRRKSGEIYPEWLHINCVRDETGKISHYVGVFSDIGPNKEIQQQLQQMAYYDPLTSLPNRRLFMDRLEQTLAQSFRLNGGFSLLFVDLNRFKNVNDAYGHGLGDALLKVVADRIREVVRESDTVARLGGDEFTVIVNDCRSMIGASSVAEKIRQMVNEPMVLDGHELNVSAAIGISFYPDDGLTIKDIIRNADTAMFHAKESGDGICFYQSGMNQDMAERLEIEGSIRRGLEEGEFWLAWQPQINLSNGSFSGAEVLARWRHNGVEIPPEKFIPIAESSGLIDELGDWIFRTAVRESLAFKKSCAHCPLSVAINFSPLQMKGEEALSQVIEVLRQNDFPPELLEIEITESVIMSKRTGAMEFLHRVADVGIAVAVDDFGTGYSNLANLKQFHVDKLKIDQSFVRDLENNQISRQIVQAVISMAHNMELKVLAEGVETDGQLALLREMGCDYGQGFLLSRPVPIDQLKVLCAGCRETTNLASKR